MAFDIEKIIFIGSDAVTKEITGPITLEESRREYN